MVLFKPALIPPDRKFDLTPFKPKYAISINIDIFMVLGSGDKASSKVGIF